MSLFQRRTSNITGPVDGSIPPRRSGSRGAVSVTSETALRHSAVWACLRLRANLVSTMPVDLYRKVDGVQVEVPKPPVLVAPGGDKVDMLEWLYSTQFDLDRSGNCFGLVTARDGMGYPARIDLVPLADVTVRVEKGEVKYLIGGSKVDAANVWHERQYTMAGLPVGLSPIAYAAWSIGEYLSIQDFALDWYGAGAIPQAHLKNTVKKTFSAEEASHVKTAFKAATEGGDMFVTGMDWEYKPIQAETAGNEWIQAKQFSIGDVARFFDTPGDLIDAMVSGSSITYANMTQRNLQFLIMNLGPAVIRRENALSKLTPRPRFVKLNTDALLRMDPQTRASTLKTRLDARMLAPSEARAYENLPPFTESQLAEFDRLYGPPKAATPAGASAPTGATT